MAKVFLNSGESFTLANSADVYGAAGTGTEKVLLTSAATGITTDQNVERVELSGNISAYTFQVVGNQVKVYAGTTLVTTIGVQGDTDGTKVAFADGSADLKVTGLNQATLGGQAVGTTAAAITGATLNATDKSATAGSGSTPGVGQAYTLTTAATDVFTLGTGNDTVTGAAGTLNTGDVVSDASTTDNDTLTVALSAGTIKPTITNVENVNLDFKGFNITYDAASTSNGTITATSTQDGNNKATFTNLSSSVKVAIGSGITDASLGGSFGNLKLNGGALNLSSTAASTGTFNIQSANAANTVTLGSNFATTSTLNIAGDKDITLKAAATSIPLTITKSLTSGSKLTVDLTASGAVDLSKVAADSFTINTGYAVGAGNYTMASTASLAENIDLSGTAWSVAATGSGTNDTLNLTLGSSQNGAANGQTITGYENININVTKALNPGVIALGTTTNAENIKILGTGDVTVTGTSSGFTVSSVGAPVTIDASGLTGKLTFGDGTNGITLVAANSAGVTVVGTANDDTFDTSAATSPISHVGGKGNDTFTSNIFSAAHTLVGGEGNDIFNTTSAGGTLAGVIAGGDGVDTLNLGTTATAAAISIPSTNNITGVENINFLNTSGNVSLTLNDANTAAGTTLTIKAKGLLAAGSAAVSIDGSAEKDGNLIIDVSGGTSTGAATLKGGAGNDTIYSISAAGSASITGGKGVDTLYLSGGTDKVIMASGDTGITTATADVINSFTKGTDTLAYNTNATGAYVASGDLGSGWSVSSGVATYSGSSADPLSAFITAATAAGKVAGSINSAVAFVSGADTYVFFTGSDATSNTDDGLVKLVGTTLVSGTDALGSSLS